MRYYVVSDVHGFYDELIRALEEKGFFEDTQPNKLIVCGDLMDRGTKAAELQDFIMKLLGEGRLIFIRGNHEDLLVKMLCDIEERAFDDFGMADFERGSSYHVKNGTWSTALQLANMQPRYAIVRPRPFVAKVRQTDFYKKLLPAAVNYFETKNYVFVHGWIPCTSNGANNSYRAFKTFTYNPGWREATGDDWYFARWYNGMEFACKKRILVPGKTVVCGHWHTSYGHSVIEGIGSEFDTGADFSPFKAEGILAIDACTAVSGQVNCVVIEDAEV